MNEEMLSTLMDGEISPLETRRLLNQLRTDPQGLATWERYNAARAVLHTGFPSMPAKGFAERVMEEIKNDAEIRTATGVKPWLAYAAAAAVTGVALFGLWQTSIVDTPSSGIVAAEPRDIVAVPQVASAVPVDRSESRGGSVEQVAVLNETTSNDIARLNSYLVNHSEHASPSMIPVRLVGFSAAR